MTEMVPYNEEYAKLQQMMAEQDLETGLEDIPPVSRATFLKIAQGNSAKGVREFAHLGAVVAKNSAGDYEAWIEAGKVTPVVPVLIERCLEAPYPYENAPKDSEGNTVYSAGVTWNYNDQHDPLVSAHTQRDKKKRVIHSEGRECKVREKYVLTLYFPERDRLGQAAFGMLGMAGLNWKHARRLCELANQRKLVNPETGTTQTIPSYFCIFYLTLAKEDTEKGAFNVVIVDNPPEDAARMLPSSAWEEMLDIRRKAVEYAEQRQNSFTEAENEALDGASEMTEDAIA